jgi:signal peptidase I
MTHGRAAAPEASGPRWRRQGAGRYLGFVASLVLAVLAIRSFVMTPFTIPSESMLPGLAKGDYLLVSKWPYGWSRWSLPRGAPLIPGTIAARLPARGDVAVFRHPLGGADYIKRVIGLPGDTVALRGGHIYLNGVAVPRRASGERAAACAAGDPAALRGRPCAQSSFTETLPGGRRYRVLDSGPTPQDDFAPVTVPEGHVFMLGDNRDKSFDSRFPASTLGGVGMVPLARLVGRLELVLFSPSGRAGWPWRTSDLGRP